MRKPFKKSLATIMTLLLVLSTFSCFAFSANAKGEYTSGNYTYIISGGEAIITKCDTASDSNITIPSTIDDYPVTGIANFIFYNCETLTSITIPDSVTYLGKSAFKNCTNLKTVILGNGISTIYQNTFEGCKNLESINITNSINEIYEYAFYGCEGLESIIIPDKVYRIGQSAFCDCTSLKNISLPDNAVSIRTNAFFNTAFYNNSENWTDGLLYIGNHFIKGNESIEKCLLKEGTVSVAANALYGCYNLILDKISFPDSIAFIGDTFSCPPDDWDLWNNGCFYIDNHLIYVNRNVSGDFKIKDGTVTIAGYAFDGCDKLTSVTMPNSITTVGELAFGDCTNLRSIDFSDNLRFIGFRAFVLCESLKSATIPGTIEYIGGKCFDTVSEPFTLKFEQTNGQHISLGSESIYYLGTDSLILPSGITHLSAGTLSFTDSVDFIHIPDTVVSISDQDLGNEKNKYICSNTDSEYLRAYAEAKNIEFRVCSGHDGHTPSDPTAPDEPVNPDNPSDEWAESTPEINKTTTNKINYGDTLVLTLGEIEIPEGYAVKWFVEGTGVSTWVSEDGLECRVTSIANGNATIYAKLVDADENVVTNSNGEEIYDEITVTSKAGFWQKFISFFKNLFGIIREVY